MQNQILMKKKQYEPLVYTLKRQSSTDLEQNSQSLNSPNRIINTNKQEIQIKIDDDYEPIQKFYSNIFEKSDSNELSNENGAGSQYSSNLNTNKIPFNLEGLENPIQMQSFISIEGSPSQSKLKIDTFDSFEQIQEENSPIQNEKSPNQAFSLIDIIYDQKESTHKYSKKNSSYQGSTKQTEFPLYSEIENQQYFQDLIHMTTDSFQEELNKSYHKKQSTMGASIKSSNKSQKK